MSVASGVQTRAAHPQPAEWAGKPKAWPLAKKLIVAPPGGPVLGSEYSSATLGRDGGVPSQFPWVDRVRVAFAEGLG